MTWSDAQDYCNDTYGTSLATITSDYENDVVVETAYEEFGQYTDFWIGLGDITTEGDYQWADGTGDAASIYINWDSNQPDALNSGDDCVHMWNTDKWNDNACTTTMRFVCNYPQYHLVDSINEEWFDANDHCKNTYGTNLAIITNKDSDDYAKNMIQTEGISSVWIGCNDIENEGLYKWVGGYGFIDDIYQGWQSSSPSNSSDENCCRLESTGWDNIDCVVQDPFLCNFAAS